MASRNRFFDDEDEIEEEEEEAPEEVDDDSFFEDDEDDQSVKVNPIKKSCEDIARHVEAGNIKAANYDYGLLQKALKYKSFVDNNVPNYLIRCIGSSIDALPKDSKDKRTQKLLSDLQELVAPYPAKMNAYRSNAANFSQDEDDDDDFGHDDFGDGSDGGEGGWFDESDDEEVEEIKKQVNTGTTRQKREISAAEALAARLEAEKNRVITDDICIAELNNARASRGKGKITITTTRLNDLLEATKNSTMKHDLKLEICLTVNCGPTDSAIPLKDWSLVLKVLPDLLGDARLLGMLFERLDRDFWARSVDHHHLFTPETSELHSMLPNYLDVLRKFANTLIKEGDVVLGATLQQLLIQYEYSDETKDVTSLALSVLDVASQEGNFAPEIALNYRLRAALFLASNLAVRKQPELAHVIVKGLPMIPDNLPLTRILFNRALATIGLSAFNLGMYKLCLDTVQQFSKQSARVLGQSPNIYPPWLNIDPYVLETTKLLSAMMLDMPYLCNRALESVGTLLVPQEIHRELQRAAVIFKPEDLQTKIALAIYNAKKGNWEEAWKVIEPQFKPFSNSAEFLSNLKDITLSCFMLTASEYYDSIAVEYLAKKFVIDESHVVVVMKSLLGGAVPITGAKISFKGELTHGDKMISFTQIDTESPLVELGANLTLKAKLLDESLTARSNH